MENKGGLHLSWYQAILICTMILGTFGSSFLRADAQLSEKALSQDLKIECKLDKTRFDSFQAVYVKKHQKIVTDVMAVKDQVLKTEKQLLKRMNDSEKEIIRILTRMESNQ